MSLNILLIAIGLSMDAFAVAITSGIVNKNFKKNFAIKIAFFFGFFQAFMPLLGWLLGISFKNYVSSIDHWIAFILLSLIGGKMIFESFKDEDEQNKLDYNKNSVLTTLAIATSIDALAIGIGFSFLNIDIINSSIIIGIITFIFSFLGVYLGKKFGHLFGNKVEIFGGIILIGIGLKILIEHTMI